MPFAYETASQKIAAVVIVLRGTALTCDGWHRPQTSGATRRSPGLMKRTNSGDSPRSGAKARAMSSRFIVSSERQDRVGEDVVERLAALVDVLESRPRLEARGAADDDDVLVEERPPAHAEGDVGAEGAVDGALEQ